jgi:hypothetical protein
MIILTFQRPEYLPRARAGEQFRPPLEKQGHG